MNLKRLIQELPKEATKMKKKHYTNAYVSVVAILLSCLGAISIGFATWIISKDDTSTISGEIEADKVNTNINGVNITPSCFSMGHYYYDTTTSSSSIVHSITGILSYEITINKNVLNQAIISDDALTLSLNLTFAKTIENESQNLSIFEEPTYLSSVSYDESPKLHEVTSDNKAVMLTIEEDVSGFNGTITKILSFSFTQQLVAKFYDIMRGGKFYLNVEAD